jgi:hypothetical protein
VRRRGGNARIGPALPGLLRAAGLKRVEVGVVQPVDMVDGAKVMCYLTLERTAAAVTGEGLATAEEVAAIVAELRAFAADPTTLVSVPRMVHTWGRVRLRA